MPGKALIEKLAGNTGAKVEVVTEEKNDAVAISAPLEKSGNPEGQFWVGLFGAICRSPIIGAAADIRFVLRSPDGKIAIVEIRGASFADRNQHALRERQISFVVNESERNRLQALGISCEPMDFVAGIEHSGGHFRVKIPPQNILSLTVDRIFFLLLS